MGFSTIPGGDGRISSINSITIPLDSSHSAVKNRVLLSKAVAGDRVSHAAMRNMMVPLPSLSWADGHRIRYVLLCRLLDFWDIQYIR